ncbi:stAR-related lipid transfer protein 9 isoform X2 [Tamandua tetradactyla]|uniref:stAR-related lipid transfer protein 9 isoform X2 n=1 Tax=Tamandua tetradactyla TaxID=48850 RepID=UPI0040546B06
MANVRVAVRVRPLSKKETKDGSRIIVEVDGKVAKVRNLKVVHRPDGFGDSREKVVAFGFDYCYWSVNPEDPQYASQDVVFQDLGTEVLSGAAKGYNICLFAYGQTGSGKTYTMLGNPASIGLTPRICEGLFDKEEDYASLPSSCRIKVSFLEIYNERVRDLLKQSDHKKSCTLRVREHPEMGPYVQGLSQHVVTNYKQVIQLLEEGIANRITAATHVHEASSRSHAIFTIHYTQAILESNLPSEIASKITLVDLAGSERADPSYCKDRITEGANINKSLVTLGIVISTLAQNSQVFSSCQSLNSIASDGGESEIPNSPSGIRYGGGTSRRPSYIPYRDSVLTWLLKDCLGGNSKTIMVATVSPAHTSYNETMSTLRYASNAKNIINKPRVNEDANVKLIRELREEIERLKAMLLSFEVNFSSLNEERNENLKELVLQNDMKIDQLTKDWIQKWNDWKVLMEHYRVDINRRRAGIVIDSSLPHLMALENDVLSTGVVLYHLKEGTTKIGRIDSDQEQDIVLQGQWIERDHCTITSACGVVILQPGQGARCTVNGREVTASCRLTQGAVITLGKAQKFRFNHPAEAAFLRRWRQVGEASGGSSSLEWLDLDGDVTGSRLGVCPWLWEKRRVLEECCGEDPQQQRAGEKSDRAQIQQQHCNVEDLIQQILAGQIRAEQELEFDQTHINQEIKDNQIIGEETWLASLQQQQDYVAEEELEASVAPDVQLQTDSKVQPSTLVRSQKQVVQLHLLRRHAFRTAERTVWRKKITFQLERIIKKQRQLEAQKRLEQIKALFWLQDDSTQKSPNQISHAAAVIPRPLCRSKSTSCSSLSCQRFCSQDLPQPHSVFLHWDPSTTLPVMSDPIHQASEKTLSEKHLPQASFSTPRIGDHDKNDLCSSGQEQLCITSIALARKEVSTPGTCLTLSPESASTQEMERMGKQPHQVVSQDSAPLNQLAEKLKPRDEPEALTPVTWTRRTTGIIDFSHMQAEWQKEGTLETHKTSKKAGCSSSHSHEPKQAAEPGKTAKTFQTEAKRASPGSKRQWRVVADRARDTDKKSSYLPHGNPLKRQHSAGDPDTMVPSTNSSLVVDHARQNDLSDTDSCSSVDSLSCVYAKSLKEPLKAGVPQGKNMDFPEPENFESDNSLISENLLAEKGYQTQKYNPENIHPTNGHGYHKDRTRTSVRSFTIPLDSGLRKNAHRSFSLDSLIDIEEEVGEDWQEEPLLGSTYEMPTETFWHLKNSSTPVVDQEAMNRLGAINQGIGTRLEAILPTNSSFYLDPQFQSHYGQPEPEMEACCSEQTNSLQGMQLSRGSPLTSMDSWFSCDSRFNPSNPPGIVDSLCPSPDAQEFQSCDWERPGYWLNMEEPKPSSAEAVQPYSFQVLQCSAELPCNARDVNAIPVSDTSMLSFWGIHRFLQPGADGTFQGRGISNMSQQDGSEASNNSSVSSVLAASAASFTHVGSSCERDWATLQQKYLLELSHPCLKAIEKSRPTFPCLEEDSGSLAQASGKGGDSLPGISSSLDFKKFPIHLSKIRHLRAEREQDSLGAKLEGPSNFYRTNEKEMSCNGTSSTGLESLASGNKNAQVFAAESKIPNSVVEISEIKQNNVEECSQDSREPELMTCSDECFFLKNPCHSNGTIIATKENHWSQGGTPLRRNIAGQLGQLRYNNYHSLQKEKADCQESTKEIVGRDSEFSFAFSSDPELYLHCIPWAPFPSSIQPPPLETFYVTKSRDVLTETALEIPACREVGVPFLPLMEAWAFGHGQHVLQDVYLKNNLPGPLRNQNTKISPSLQIAAERPVDLNTREGIREMEKCPEDIKEGSCNSVSVSQNGHFLLSTSRKVCEFENKIGILNIKHSVLASKDREKATAQSSCNVSPNNLESGKPLFVCESKAVREEKGQKAVQRQTQAFDINRHFPSGTMSDFIHKPINLGLEKDIPGEIAISLKSRSVVDHHVSSPGIVAQDESSPQKWEGMTATGRLTKALHPSDSLYKLKLPGADPTYERLQSITSSKERNPNECKGPGKSQEMLNPKEPPETNQNKQVNNAEEMARLIKSVVQLENGILEIESKQNKKLLTSQIPRVGKETGYQNWKEQKAECVQRPDSSGEPLSFKDQPPSPKQKDDVIFRDSEAEEMKEHNSCIGKDSQVQKINQSPFKAREYIEKIRFAREHNHLDALDRSLRDTCGYLGVCTAYRESASTSLNPRKNEVLSRAFPLQPRSETSSEDEDELFKASSSPKRQPCGLENLEELVTMKGAEHINSSKQEKSKVQGKIEEMAVQRGGSLQEENKMVSLTQKFSSRSQVCRRRIFSQETVCPLLSQADYSTVPSYQDLSNILPLSSLSLLRSYLHAPDTISISSVDSVLHPTMLKINDSPLVAGVRDQKQSENTKIHSPQGNARRDSFVAHSAWCGCAIAMALGSHGQSSAPESIPLEAEDRISASTTPQDQAGNFRGTLMDWSTREGFVPEAEAAGLTEIKSSLNEVSSELEKRTSCSLEEGNYQGRETGRTVENNSEDLSLISNVFSAPVSLLRVPNPDPRMLEPSAHTSNVYLVMLEEIKQAKAQGKQLNDFGAERTILPYRETLLESECSSRVPERSQCKQVNESVSDGTRNEGEAQKFYMAFSSAEPGYLLTEERKVLQATPCSVDSFQLLPSTETNKGTWCPSQASSHDIPTLDKGHFTGELRHFFGADKQFMWHSDYSKIRERNKGATRTPSFAGSLCSESLPPLTAVEEDRRKVPEKLVLALSSEAHSDISRLDSHEESQLAPCDTAGTMCPGSQESSSEHQEPRILDNKYGGSSGNFLVTSEPEEENWFKSQSVICDVHNSAGLSGPKQDHVQCLERSTALEEVKASPKQGNFLCEDLRRIELEESSQQCVMRKSCGGFGLAGANRLGSKHPGPTSFPDQRPSPCPKEVSEETPFRCPEETQDCIISGSLENLRTLTPSRGQEESRILPSQQLCSSQPIASLTSSSHSSSLFYYGGDLAKGPSRVAPGTVHPASCIVPSRACDVVERGKGYSREHSLKPTGINMESGLTDSHTQAHLETAVNLALAQGSSRLAPDVRTSSFNESQPGSVEGPEKKCFEKKISPELELVPFPTGMYPELLRKFQNRCIGGQSTQVSQTKPELPTTNGRPNTLNLGGGSVESGLAVEPQHGYLDNTFTCLPEKTQFSMESRDHHSLDPQANILAKLKHMHSTRADSLWEEEEQQRDQALGNGKAPAQGGNPPPSDEEGLDGCQISDSTIEEKAVSKPKRLSSDFKDSATVLLEHSGPQPSTKRLGQSNSDREQPPPHHRYSAPVIAVFSGSRHSLKTFPRPQFSVVSSSQSLQELNMSVEPPSPTDEDNQDPNRLWNPHPQDDPLGVSAVKTSLATEDCSQKASCNLDGRTADHRPLKPTTPPYPTSSALSCMPTPDFMASWMSGTLEQAWEERPEKLGGQAVPEEWLSKADKGMLHFGSSDISSCNLPCCPERPRQIGWKQYVFGGTVDGSCSQTPQGVIPSNVAQCPSTDNGLEDENFPFYSHLSTYSSARDLSSTHGSIQNIRHSNDVLEVWDSSFALGNPHIMTGTNGAAPMRGPEKRPQFRALPDKMGCLKSEPPLPEGSTAGPVNEIMLLYPSEAVHSVGQNRKDTFERGTQTLSCRLHQHCTDVSPDKSKTSATSVSDLASWTSMHNLSLHLSQLLHSTSELLGSLSQPSVPEKEQNTKKETLDETPPILMADSCTQTPVDEGSQTDIASSPLPFQAPEAKPQGVNMILEVLDSDILTVSQGMGDTLVLLQERETTETSQGTAGPPDLQEESIQCRPQKLPVSSSYLRFQKVHLGQNLPSLNTQVSDASLPASSQPEESSCLAVSRPSFSVSHSPESTGEPRIEKTQGPTSTLLVDRASSPILTVSASTEGSCLPPSSLSVSAPSAHSFEGHQKLDSSLDLPLGAPRSPIDNYSQTIEESPESERVQAVCGEGRNPLENSDGRSFLELSSFGNLQQSPKFQVNFLGQRSQQLQPRTTQVVPTWVQSGQLPPPLRSKSQKLPISFVPEEVASPESGPLCSRGRSRLQSRTENRGENSALIMKSQLTSESSSSWADLKQFSPCPISELTDTIALQGSTLGSHGTCNPEGLLSPGSQMCIAPEPQHHSLTDLPMHNKFRNWGGVQGDSSDGQGMTKELGTGCDLSSREQVEILPQSPEDKSQDPEWSQGKQVPLQVGAQNLSFSMELTEARLHHGFGQADALLQVLQSGTGTALAPDEHTVSTWKELYARSPEASARPAQASSDVELMLQDYQRAREEAKVKIAQARERLRERTEQEKLMIRQQIVSQLLKEEEKLHALANASPLCTSSNGSLSSGITSGYNSNTALSGQFQSPESLGDTNSSDSREPWMGDRWGCTAVRNKHLYLARSTWKSSAYGHRASLGSCCCSPSSLSSLGPCFSSSYQDLAKHIVDISMADVMAACSDNLHNLFSHQVAAGWKYQGEEQEVQLYYKVFSSTRHGFLGAGVVCQPLPQVWAAVSDPTLWPLYHKPIQTARLHHRVTNSINLVYLVCDTTSCALTQPRDFCCVCVEAKEGHLSIMAAQSVYDASMPRPRREMVRGEILPSAWILQPLNVNGQEITRVIYLSQVELGAPGIPPQLLNSFIKQQPLVVARLASFLGS